VSTVEWWSIEIGVLAVMAIIVWLTVKDTVKGFFQCRILAALIGLLAIAALIFTFVFILSIYYMPGWAIALTAAVIASISLWFAAPRAPIFLVVVAFAATVSVDSELARRSGLSCDFSEERPKYSIGIKLPKLIDQTSLRIGGDELPRSSLRSGD
jgi:hypothetical protein